MMSDVRHEIEGVRQFVRGYVRGHFTNLCSCGTKILVRSLRRKWSEMSQTGSPRVGTVNMPRHRREPGNPDIRTCNPTLTTKLIIYVVHCFEDVHRLQQKHSQPSDSASGHHENSPCKLLENGLHF
jgi:hypothetical protein